MRRAKVLVSSNTGVTNLIEPPAMTLSLEIRA
jgi:hypothetical protein